MIPKELQPHLVEFLERVKDWLSCNGCNDWDFTPEELAKAREFIGDPEAGNWDYMVLAVLRKAIGPLAGTAKGDKS